MKILSIDTASDICGVSILEDNTLICTLDLNTGRTHSENLMPMISDALSKSNLTLNNIDLIVCDIGPGSFTGIRIGIATAKAFFDSLNIKITGVNSLESLAYNTKQYINDHDYICSIIDCKNSNCYYSIYQLINNEYIEIVPPTADNIENLVHMNSILYDANIIFVGNGSILFKDMLKNNFKKCKFAVQNDLNSYCLALAGLNKFCNNNLCDVLPLYLKKPQAQRQLEEKIKKGL